MCHFGARVERPERRGVVSVAGGAWCGLRLLSVRGSTLLPSIDEVGRSEDVSSWMSGLSFVGDLGGERSGSLSTVTVGESVVRGQGLEMFGMGAGGMPVGSGHGFAIGLLGYLQTTFRIKLFNKDLSLPLTRSSPNVENIILLNLDIS